MSVYSLTTLFVVPESNTLPASGLPSAMAAKKFGVFKNDDLSVATLANIASANYVQFFQQNPASMPAVYPTKRSDRIKTALIQDWYKVPAKTTSTVQITELTAWNFKYDEDITLTLRVFSNELGITQRFGLTRSVVAKTPCPADCPDDPCATLSDEETDAVVADLAAKINADTFLSAKLVASVTGTTATADLKLILTGNAPDAEPTSPWLFNNPYELDRIYFHTYIRRGPDTAQDYVTNEDRCLDLATVEITQWADYPKGAAGSIKKWEKFYHGHQSIMGALTDDPDFNADFESLVTAAFYDTYVVKFGEPENYQGQNSEPMTETVIICVPTGEGATLEALLTAAWGAPSDKSAGTFTYTDPLVP